jgi:hypothetical protein
MLQPVLATLQRMSQLQHGQPLLMAHQQLRSKCPRQQAG